MVEVGIDLDVAGVDLAHLRRRGQRCERQTERCHRRKGKAGERLPHIGPPKIEPRRYGETCVNHDSLWRAGNERAMTRVEFTPERIIRATQRPRQHEKKNKLYNRKRDEKGKKE